MVDTSGDHGLVVQVEFPRARMWYQYARSSSPVKSRLVADAEGNAVCTTSRSEPFASSADDAGTSIVKPPPTGEPGGQRKVLASPCAKAVADGDGMPQTGTACATLATAAHAKAESATKARPARARGSMPKISPSMVAFLRGA